jgi:tetratricopeptide (TPR) repeat protein
VLTQTAAELGYASEARERLRALTASGVSDLPFNEGWLVSLSLLSETAAALEDAAAAAVLYEGLQPYGDHVAIAYPEIAIGSVARYLGLAATTMERWDDAERHFGNALSVNERIGARPWLAHTRRDFARMLIARGEPADRDRASRLLESARTGYEELGMRAWVATVSAG